MSIHRPTLACQNKRVADFNIVMHCNVNCQCLGAGSGAQSTFMYSSKYICKNTAQISISASHLKEAMWLIKDYPSTAEVMHRWWIVRGSHEANGSIHTHTVCHVLL